jgi:hypothetical protein
MNYICRRKGDIVEYKTPMSLPNKQRFAGHQVQVEVGWFLESKRKKTTVFERDDQAGFGCRW